MSNKIETEFRELKRRLKLVYSGVSLSILTIWGGLCIYYADTFIVTDTFEQHLFTVITMPVFMIFLVICLCSFLDALLDL